MRRTITIIVVIGLGAGLLWLRPFPASEAAVAALSSDQEVTVTATRDMMTFIPNTPTDTGLIFYPGARVEPRAYAVLMRALAARGTAIFIIKLPYDIAFFAQDRATAIIDAHLEIRIWAVGGHSLGGVVASSYAAAHTDRVAGLLLYASYPASDLSATLANTAVRSISGTNDGLATPAKIEQSRALLPASTQYVAIAGGVHAFFGDYGAQPGDGQPTVSRAEAQAAIITASAEFLDALEQR